MGPKNAIGGRKYVRKVTTMFAESRHRLQTRTSERKREQERKERNNQENCESDPKITKIFSNVANIVTKSRLCLLSCEVGREHERANLKCKQERNKKNNGEECHKIAKILPCTYSTSWVASPSQTALYKCLGPA